MSMILNLVALSDANISRVLADPPLIWQVIAPGDTTMYEAARAAQKSTFLSRIFGTGKSATDATPLELSSFEGGSVDLDKAWHGIHYLLTNTASGGDRPLSLLVAGGTPVGDIDVGYGPARAFTATQTRAAHEALAALTNDALRLNFDPSDMMANEIYPEIWDDDSDGDDAAGYLIEYADTLRGFLRETTNAGLGTVVYLA
jgi:hypothetical protein